MATDLPAIVAIYNASIPGRLATADLSPVSAESRLTWFERHDPARRPLWALDDGGAIIAWLSFNDFYEGRPAYDATAEISLYVAPDRQRQGAGRMLLSEAIRRAPSLRVNTLLAFVFDHNIASLALFGSLGFTSWGHLPGIALLDGQERGLVILGRRLAGGRPESEAE